LDLLNLVLQLLLLRLKLLLQLFLLGLDHLGLLLLLADLMLDHACLLEEAIQLLLHLIPFALVDSHLFLALRLLTVSLLLDLSQLRLDFSLPCSDLLYLSLHAINSLPPDFVTLLLKGLGLFHDLNLDAPAEGLYYAVIVLMHEPVVNDLGDQGVRLLGIERAGGLGQGLSHALRGDCVKGRRHIGSSWLHDGVCLLAKRPYCV